LSVLFLLDLDLDLLSQYNPDSIEYLDPNPGITTDVRGPVLQWTMCLTTNQKIEGTVKTCFFLKCWMFSLEGI